MKLLFLVMSAIHAPGTVQQLVDALAAEGDEVLLHHDFSQQPEFPVSHPQASFVPDPRRTGWGVWGTAEAVIHSLGFALKSSDFDYFQLVSPTCLPIKPIGAFKRHLAAQEVDANIDVVSLADDPVAMMSHGFRAYARKDSFRFRLLRRTSRMFFKDHTVTEHRAGLSFPLLHGPRPAGMRSTVSSLMMRTAKSGIGFDHPFDDRTRCFVGNFWFGGTRRAADFIVRLGTDNRIARYCRSLHIPEEIYFPTILANSSLRLGPSNHLISPFKDANPIWFDTSHLGMISASDKHLARKFPNDPAAEIRRIVIESL